MCNTSPFEPATWEEVEGALTDAIRSSAGGQMTRNAEVFLAGVCAKHLSERLALAGFVVMRHATPLAESERSFDQANLHAAKR